MKVLAILFFFVNSTACVTAIGIPDIVKSPMTLGKKVLDVSAVENTNPTSRFIFPDKVTDDVSPLSGPSPYAGLRLSYGITDTIDVGLELTGRVTSVANALNADVLSLGVKYQWLGESIFQTKKVIGTRQLN